MRRLGQIAGVLLVVAIVALMARRAQIRNEMIATMPTSSGPGPTSTTQFRVPADGTPVAPAEIDVALDPDGRPYDAPATDWKDVDLRPVPIATFTTPDGTIRIASDGTVGTGSDPEDPSVTFDGAKRLEVSALATGTGADDLVQGLRIDVPGAKVARWRSFEPAYATDGGTGIVMTEAGHDRYASMGFDELADALNESTTAVLDPDDPKHPDIIMFANNYGDGEFPMSRGIDAQGRTVSLVVWDTTYPWRLAVPDGTPPPDVTRREDQLQACLDGKRDLVADPYWTGTKTEIPPPRCDDAD